MLSGIVRREDYSEKRKAPILGDIPILGGLFRSIDKGQRNRELVAFITPRVIRREARDETQMAPGDKELLEKLRKSLGGSPEEDSKPEDEDNGS